MQTKGQITLKGPARGKRQKWQMNEAGDVCKYLNPEPDTTFELILNKEDGKWEAVLRSKRTARRYRPVERYSLAYAKKHLQGYAHNPAAICEVHMVSYIYMFCSKCNKYTFHRGYRTADKTRSYHRFMCFICASTSCYSF